MKQLILYIGLVLVAGIALESCYKDIIRPDLPKDPNAPPQQVSFKNELAPVFSANCTNVGCHATGGYHPYMTPDVAYREIVSGGFVNITLPKESILYKQIYGDMGAHMPSLTDRQKVYDWIRNGAPNN